MIKESDEGQKHIMYLLKYHFKYYIFSHKRSKSRNIVPYKIKQNIVMTMSSNERRH